MTGCRDIGKNLQKYSKMEFFPINGLLRFFPISGSVTSVSLWCQNFIHKTRKKVGCLKDINNLKTDQRPQTTGQPTITDQRRGVIT